MIDRRKMLFITTGAVAAGGAIPLSRPLLGHMKPAQDVLPPIEFDLTTLGEGEHVKLNIPSPPCV